MLIEAKLISYLTDVLSVPVYAMEPETPPTSYVTIEKTGSGERNQILTAMIAIQSYGSNLLAAASLNEEVKDAMRAWPAEDHMISACRVNSDYNFSDPKTRRCRYQAVFDLVYFHEGGNNT